MKYTFAITSSSGDEITFPCDAKTLNDALSQFALFVYYNNFDFFTLSYYYYVDGKKGRNQRIFNFNLKQKFWTFYNIASIMDKHHGIDKQEIL